MAAVHVHLSATDQQTLEKMYRQSGLCNKIVKRVAALLELHKGKTISAVADTLGLCYPTIHKLKNAYKAVGLECLEDKKQPGRPPKIDGAQRALITALACSEAPEGYAKWSLRLLADKIVELNYCGSISHECVGQILKKTKGSLI